MFDVSNGKRPHTKEDALIMDAIKNPISVAEAAEILGWDKRKVATYIKRGKFPDPMLRLKCGPIWERRQIEDYLKEGKK